eukprot:GHRR01030387.1.p1 GENE.GHRR01030387.1~~GHRR01030387.1.p1  ORF type:complete len:188 (+),score=34.33 GHRR01030387.1:53-616(+)
MATTIQAEDASRVSPQMLGLAKSEPVRRRSDLPAQTANLSCCLNTTPVCCSRLQTSQSESISHLLETHLLPEMLATSQPLKLSTGHRLEVLRVPAKKKLLTKPPLLFVHGSYHAAWCWQENFQPFFADAGYDSWAISLRGQGNSDRVQSAVAGTLDSHAQDLAEVVQQMADQPVMVAHSFGGLIAQK